MPLPARTADTMSDAIALSSPSGRMSRSARAAALQRLSAALFGDYTPPALPPQPGPAARAAHLRDLARVAPTRQARKLLALAKIEDQKAVSP